MPLLGQFKLHEQLLGLSTLPDPLRPISRHRIPLGSRVRKSLCGHSFPKLGIYKKESTYQLSHGVQQRRRYTIPTMPSGPEWNAIQAVFRSAVLSWQSFTPEQKLVLDLRADTIGHMSGYNLHIREYIRANY